MFDKVLKLTNLSHFFFVSSPAPKPLILKSAKPCSLFSYIRTIPYYTQYYT